MRRSTGAIFRDSRPAMIMRSAWRGDARNTSAPKRAMSYREQLIAIISMAQQASPKVTGQMADFRAQWTTFSTVVVRTGISSCCSSPIGYLARPGSHACADLVRTPIEHALAPDVDVANRQDRHERDDLHEPGPAQIPERHRPGIEERHLDVEQEEHHRHQVELDGLAFPGIPDWRDAAFIGRLFLGGDDLRTKEMRNCDVERPEPGAEHEQDQDGEPTLHGVGRPRPACEDFRKPSNPHATGRLDGKSTRSAVLQCHGAAVPRPPVPSGSCGISARSTARPQHLSTAALQHG